MVAKGKDGLQQETELYIPTDILFSFLERLPVASLQRLKYVSKAWFTTIKDPYFAESHLARQSEDEFGLIYSIGRDSIFLGNTSSSAGNFRMRNIPRYNAKVHSSCKGLVLFGDGPLHVGNPVTGDILKLPLFKGYLGILISASIVCDPCSREFKVAVLRGKSHGENPLLACFVLTLGSSAWREVRVPVTGYFPGLDKNPVSARGGLHWIYQMGILSFDIAEEKFEQKSIPFSSCFAGLEMPILLEWDGCLAVVPKSGWARTYCIYILRESGWSVVLVDISFFNRLFSSKRFYEDFPPYPVASMRGGEVIIFKRVGFYSEFLAYHVGRQVMTPFTVKALHGRSLKLYELGNGNSILTGFVMTHVDSMVSCVEPGMSWGTGTAS